MANTIFTPAKEGFIAGEIDLDTAVIKAALVKGYTISAAHKFVSDVTGASGVLHPVGSVTLASKTIANGVFDAADITFTAAAAVTGNPNHSVLLYQSSAVTGGADVAATAQRLIAIFDTGTNLPVITNGGDVTIAWDNGTNKILNLT